jgi:outer membrane protein assembly factor BamB
MGHSGASLALLLLAGCATDRSTSGPLPFSIEATGPIPGQLKWDWSGSYAAVAPVRDSQSLFVLDSVSGSVVAHRLDIGAIRWRTARVRPPVRGTESEGAPAQLFLSGTAVILIDSVARAFDRASGIPLWESRMIAPSLSGSLLAPTAGDVLVLGAASELVRLDARTGQPQWRTPLPSGCAPIALDADSVLTVVSLAACGDRRYATVLALRSATGAVVWRAPIPDSTRARYAARIVHRPDRTIVALDNALLGALDDDGRDIWSGPTEAIGLIQPFQGIRPFAVVGTTVIAIGATDVTGTDVRSGQELWRTRSSVLPSPDRGGPVAGGLQRGFVIGVTRAVGSIATSGAWGWFVPAAASTSQRPVHLLAIDDDVVVVTGNRIARWGAAQ